MGNFVDPEVTRVPLSNGGWVDVKKYLNIFDQRRAEAAGVVHVMIDDKDAAGNPMRRMADVIDWSVYDIVRTEIWVTKWLMLDSKGEPRELNTDSIKALNVEMFNEISTIIYNRIMEIAKEKKAKLMKATDLIPEPPADPTSSS